MPPSNRGYAGPSLATELQIDDGAFVLIVRKDLTDEQVAAAGYSLNIDEADSSRPYVRRSVTVSEELGLKLDRSFVDDPENPGELIPQFPRVGGTPGDVVDSPETNPCTKPVTLDDGTVISAAEADERHETAQRAVEAEDRIGIADPQAAAQLAELRSRLEGVETRIREVQATIDVADPDVDGDEIEALTAEKARLEADRATINSAIDAAQGS